MENRLILGLYMFLKQIDMESKSYSSNNYKSLEGMAMAFKMLLAALVLLFLVSAKNAFSQVTIISPNSTVTACPSFPTNSVPLPDILIRENVANDISTFGTLVLSAPTNFEFTSAGTANAGTSGDITSVTAVLTNATTITLTIVGANTTGIDTIKLSGIMFRGLNAPTALSNVTKTGGTAVINGDVNGTIHASLVSTGPPTLSSTLSPPAICAGTAFSYTPTSATIGTSFAWSRAAVAGISNVAASGTGNPNESLVNTTANTINVTYVYSLTANGCTNPNTFNVIVPVNPMPTLSSTLSPPAICSGFTFAYTPTSATPGATFAWTRATTTGISNAAASGTGNPNESLVNTTVGSVNVTYVYSVTANGCSNPNTYSVVVSVKPTPTLSSTLSPLPICSGAVFSYTPTSAVVGSTFSWTRASALGILEPASSGVGNPNEVLTDTTNQIVNVTYNYLVSANGCSNPNTYSVVVPVLSPVGLPHALAPTSITCTSFNATWNTVPGATAYLLDVSTSTSFATFIAGYNNLNVGSTTSFNVTGLTLGQNHVYRVRASNNCGTSPNSNVVVVNSNPGTPVAWPASNLTSTSFDANWGPTANTTTYYLDVSTSVSFATLLSGFNNLNVGSALTYSVSGLTSGITYYYRVRAANGCITSANSNTLSLNLANALNAPVAATGNNFVCDSFNANWGSVVGATEYFLDVSYDPNFGFGNFVPGFENKNVGNVTTFVISGLMNGSTVYYRVRASDGSVTSANSNTDTESINITPVLPPTATSASNYTCTSFNANWGAVSGATQYLIDVSTNVSFTSFLSGYNNFNVGNVTTFNIAGISPGTSYYYRVRANDGCSISLNSNTIAVVNAAPSAPIVLSAINVTCNSFDAIWNGVSGATGYFLDASTDSNFSTLLTGYTNFSTGVDTSHSVTGLDTNTTYYYRVRASNGCVASLNSSTMMVTTTSPCVWPGDANHDSIVNNDDLLSVGLYYAQTGTPRVSQGNVWQAYVASEWGTQQYNGENLKHADCNGDGTIDDNDTLAINANFNLTHAITPPTSTSNGERATSDMYFVINGSAFAAGSWVDAEIWVGTAANPISSLYGVSFNIDYDPSMVQSGSETITYLPSWLGTPGTNALKLSKIDNLASTAYGAITRTDHMNKSGYGKIADFKFQIKNTFTTQDSMFLSFSHYMAVDSIGAEKTFTTAVDTINVNATLIKEYLKAENKLMVYPNPFSSQTTILFEKELKDATVKVVDVVGKEVRSMNVSGKQLVLEKQELNSGVYFIKVISSNKEIIAQQKIIIQ